MPMNKKTFMAAMVMILLLSLVGMQSVGIAPSASAQTITNTTQQNQLNTSTSTLSSVPNAGFNDHFDDASIDASKWTAYENTSNSGNPSYGGAINVANSQISLFSSGSAFPCVTSAVSPFPTTGDFTVKFDFTYSRVSDWGCGLWISKGPVVASKTDIVDNIVFQLWANNLDYNTAAIFINLLGVPIQRQLFYGWNPSAPTQTIMLTYSAGFYTLTVNGAQLASEPSQIRADTIGFGHPPAYYIPFTPTHVDSVMGGWSSFYIDQIQVLPQSSILLSVSAASTQLGLTVDFGGSLIGWNNEPLGNKTVVLYYMIPGVANWNAFASISTDSSGAFYAVWLPTATGTFMVKAAWDGDQTNSGASDVKNVSVTSGANQILLAESNSTLTALNFNASSSSVSFTVSGPSGSTGYVRFLVSVGTLANASTVSIFVDGQATNFTSSFIGNMEILFFTYSHSTHDVAIFLLKTTETISPTLEPTAEVTLDPNPTSVLSSEDNQTQDYTLPTAIAVVVVFAVALGVLVYVRRRRAD
jgi:hypothetical protein